jgi:asparagine synthase (glutamine-hydrolysing)
MDEPADRQRFMSSTRDLVGLRMLVGDVPLPGDESVDAAYAGRPVDLQTLLAAQTKSPLVNRNFAKIDKTSMANSVEARVPFMDHELVEFVFRLPFAARTGKAILKRSMQGVLPPAILTDRKRGFNLPLQHWIERYILPDLDRYLRVGDLDRLGLFVPGGIDALLGTIRNPRRYHPKMLWNLVILSRWLEANAWTAA